MTKLEILRDYYADYRVRDSWYVLGQNTITPKTRIYNAGMIYRISYENVSSLENYLIFCNKEYIGSLNWNKAEIIDSDYGEISFGNDIISSCFYVVLSSENFSKINSGTLNGEENPFYIAPDENFIPFLEEYNKTGQVQLTDDDYDEIMSCMGSPFIAEDELEYTREQVINLAIKPALKEFFKWCPKARPEIVNCTSQIQNVPMPSDAYGVVGLSFQQDGASGNTINNPLLWSLMASPYLGVNSSSMTGTYYGKYPARTNSGGANSLLLSRAATQGYINYQKRMHYEGPYTDRDGSITGVPQSQYITIYCNILGTLNIWWGIQTLNIADVEFAQRNNVIRLCQAKVKQLFGNLRRQTKSDIPGQVDYEYLVKDGAEEEKNVIAELKKLVKSSGVLRGSL
jgi:hypothetical protein